MMTVRCILNLQCDESPETDLMTAALDKLIEMPFPPVQGMRILFKQIAEYVDENGNAPTWDSVTQHPKRIFVPPVLTVESVTYIQESGYILVNMYGDCTNPMDLNETIAAWAFLYGFKLDFRTP
jgi:hypothetical protein